MKIFLTGSNGYIGKYFLIKAAKKGNIIFAVTRKKKNEKIKNVKWLVGSIDKKWKELKKTDVLIHLATYGAHDKFASFEKCYKFNVIKSQKMIHNAFNSGCKKWLIITTKKEKIVRSTNIEYATIVKNKLNPNFMYAITKALFSKICVEYAKTKNVKCRIIRLYQVYGGIDKNNKRLWPTLVNAAKSNKDFYMTAGNQKTDFSHIENVTDGLLDALNFNKKNSNKYPQTWEMGSGKLMTVKKFANIIWKKINPTSKIFFSKIKNYDKKNYKINPKYLWKIKYTSPENSFRYEDI